MLLVVWMALSVYKITDYMVLVRREAYRLFLQCHHDADICGFDWNVSTTIGWIFMTFLFSTEFIVITFGDLLMFRQGPPSNFRFIQNFGFMTRYLQN